MSVNPLPGSIDVDSIGPTILPLTPSTSRVLSSANTDPVISLTVFVVSSSAKFSLIFLKAVLNGSPSPLFALEPILIVCIAIKLSLPLLL